MGVRLFRDKVIKHLACLVFGTSFVEHSTEYYNIVYRISIKYQVSLFADSKSNTIQPNTRYHLNIRHIFSFRASQTYFIRVILVLYCAVVVLNGWCISPVKWNLLYLQTIWSHAWSSHSRTQN